jgi:glycerate kinase
MPAQVRDPLGRLRDSFFWILPDERTAVIELADAAGLRLLQPTELNPLQANTAGLGQLMQCALDLRVSRIILCIGGSATVDGGSGMLQVLGWRFLDEAGHELTRLPQELQNLQSLDDKALDPRIADVELVLLCDVENLLLGPAGAAAAYGPQKGANPGAVKELEWALTRFRDVVLRQMGVDMSTWKFGGAAGGIAAGLAALANAKLVSGADYFLDLTQFDQALRMTDLLITGEGSLDSQTLRGKAPMAAAARAVALGLPVIALAGRVPEKGDRKWDNYFSVVLSIGTGPQPLERALLTTSIDLERTARELGNVLATGRRLGK